MQIVIELDKEDYEKIKKTSFVENTETMLNQSSEDRKNTMMLFRVIDAIKDGTPVPKVHDINSEAENYLLHCVDEAKSKDWASGIKFALATIEKATKSNP